MWILFLVYVWWCFSKSLCGGRDSGRVCLHDPVAQLDQSVGFLNRRSAVRICSGLFSFDYVLDDEVPEEYIKDGGGCGRGYDCDQDEIFHLNIYGRLLLFFSSFCVRGLSCGVGS